MRATNRLSDPKLRNAKPQAKPYKLADGEGLYLLVNPDGSKYWRLKYRFKDRERLLSLGIYPHTALVEARKRRTEARTQLAMGIDPSAARKARKAAERQADANSFEVVAREWHAKMAKSWVPGHAEKVIARLIAHAFPWIGTRPVSEITATELLPVLRKLEARGLTESAHRLRQTCGQVFRYAVVTGRADRDPAADLKDALEAVDAKHMAAVTDPKAVGPLLLMLDGYTGTPVVKAALQLAPLTFVRPGELRQALWRDVDLDAGEWRFTASKTGKPHIVPLSKQAVEILRELYPITGRGEYVFPGARTPRRPMSDNAVLAALRNLGIPKEEMTGHGFRAMARTILDQELRYPVDWIEHQLAHEVRDALGRAYNRTTHLEGRRTMMQAWADYLDGRRAVARGENVITVQFVRELAS